MNVRRLLDAVVEVCTPYAFSLSSRILSCVFVHTLCSKKCFIQDEKQKWLNNLDFI